MKFRNWVPRTLKARVTLLTLAIFVVGMWVLALLASQILKEGIQRVSGEQQLATASYIAAETDEQISSRLRALEAIAAHITPYLMGNPRALQDFLDTRIVFEGLFNHGTVVLRSDGIAIGEFPENSGRRGTNYMSTDSAARAIKEGRSSIGKPTIGKRSGVPLVVMSVPIRNAEGNIIGAMTGVTRLDTPNFLDKITKGAYGDVANYVLTAPQHKMYITGSDKSQIMQPMLDSFAQGAEGISLVVNAHGVEEFMAVKQIPVAGWYVGVAVPTSVVYSPVAQMQSRLVWAAALVTLILGTLSWWVLRLQLSPLHSAIDQLIKLREPEHSLSLLPIAREDEIGALFQSFNHLLENLLRLNTELEESRQILRDHAAQTESVREDERKHIAREVHDELGQVLTALRMDISLMGMRFEALDPELPLKISGMKALVDRAIQGVRNVAVNLRPTALDMGLIPAIEWLQSEFTRTTGVPCTLLAREENVDLDESRAVVVFRIVQESLTNITRYAKASRVDITIGRRGNELWVQVRDNGQGFDALDRTKQRSFGLLGMRERALALGGYVEINSTPGQGTIIAMTAPLSLADDKEVVA